MKRSNFLKLFIAIPAGFTAAAMAVEPEWEVWGINELYDFEPSRSQFHVNSPLTDISIAYINKSPSFISTGFFPAIS